MGRCGPGSGVEDHRPPNSRRNQADAVGGGRSAHGRWLGTGARDGGWCSPCRGSSAVHGCKPPGWRRRACSSRSERANGDPLIPKRLPPHFFFCAGRKSPPLNLGLRKNAFIVWVFAGCVCVQET